MMNVNEYHKLHELSCSKLKLFTKSLWKFKKWSVDHIEPPQATSSSIKLGNLVDFKLLRDIKEGHGDEELEEVFSIYTGKAVTGQILELAEELYEVTTNSMDDNGEVNRSFESMFQEAIDNYVFDANGDQVKFKKTKTDIFAKVLDEFSKKGGLAYYESLRSNTGKQVVTIRDIEIANKLVTNLKSHWTTRSYFLAKSENYRDVINQFAYVFEIEGKKFKILIDKVFVNHTKKTIYPFDLKTTFSSYQFENNFIDLGYYFQLGAYTHGLASWVLEKKYTNYTVHPLQFIVCPTTFTEAPFVVKSSWDDYDKAMNGFKYRDRHIKGVKQCVQEIKFHQENNVWDMSKELHDNKGIQTINFMK